MKKFLVSVLLLIPFITSAQSTPQLQVSNLSTERYEYSVGQEIKGSFVLNNIGNSDIPDLQYYIAVGNYGEKGGILQNETTATPLSDVIYLPKTEKQNINFTIIPEKIPAGAMGLHVVIAQKNGMILGWSKIPLQITGTTQELITLEGSVVIDGIESPLLAGPTATKDSTAYVSLLSNQTGTKEFELVVYDRQFGQEIVYNQVVQAEFIDGEAKIPLPLDFKPESYAAEVKMLEGSNTVKFRYIVAGPQAEILSVNTDSLSLRENEAFVLKVSYADTPLNLDNPAATAYPENLSIKIKVFNQDGEMVDEYNGPLQSVLRNQLIEVDENSDEATLDAASNELDLLFNNAYEVEIPLTAHAKAKSLSFNVELYDSATGEIFDSYVTDFPAGDNQLMDVLLIVGALALIVVLVFIFVKTKHKIPTVCLALILTSLFSATINASAF